MRGSLIRLVVGHTKVTNGLFLAASSSHVTTTIMVKRNYANVSNRAPERIKGDDPNDEFQPLDLKRTLSLRRDPRKRRTFKEVAPPRYLKMPVNQDWLSVWPVARTFHPASVPLPLHQGYTPSHIAPPGKFANAELMKIPNFLHLTPPAIKRHCEALKKFCTPWPKELKSDDDIERHFPIEVLYSDYCHSSPTIRDHRARIVTIKLKLSKFKLDSHAQDKMLRLLGDRYDSNTDTLTIVTDVCPFRKQNYDYAMYIITALYYESWNKESWESEKAEADMEYYTWKGSVSEKTVKTMLLGDPAKEITTTIAPSLEKYEKAIETIHNEGEDIKTVEEYGASVRKLFNLPLAL